MNTQVTLMTLFLAGMAATPAAAQVSRKPDATPIRADDRYTFDESRWSHLYQLGGEPTILILAGLATAERPGRGVGASLLSMDAEGDASILRSELERTFLTGQGVEVANLDAISDMDRRDANLLLLSRERDAVDLLATAVNAPLVLVARLQPTHTHGSKYRVTFEAIDVPRGRTISTIAFDWQGGDDTRTIKRYARLLANDFLDGYERHVGGMGQAMPYTVRILGADMQSLRTLTTNITNVPGVDRARVTQRQQSREASIAELSVRYAGSAFDLAGAFMDAGNLGAGLELDSLDMTSGTIVLRAIAGAGRMDRATSWRMLGAHQSRATIDTMALAEAYAAAGKPRIAMLIGRSLSPWEIDQPWFINRYGSQPATQPGSPYSGVTTDHGSNNIFITIAEDVVPYPAQTADWWGGVVTPHYHPRETEKGMLDNRHLEDLMLDRLGAGGLGLRMVDAVTLRERALAEHPRLVFRDAELIELVRESGLADIAILGDGRLENERGYTTVRYTLRAIQLETGEILAVAPAVVELDDRADAEEVEEILNALAEQASTRLVQDLLLAWTN